jgi:alkanesulfonate monooxygenase SsuD/methylene tetrahydromethanopterin reductase-like flavin-dependent oxidoreductase (luciferase family)
MFLMRFDMRAPAFGSAAAAELYATALDMAEWGEQNGCMQVVISEHHGSEDGYLSSPLVLASAIAARTKTLPIQLAALIVPLHDPLRLAEDMAVLDLLSGGRVSYVTAVGYVESEFEMLGRSFRGRGKRMDQCLAAMRSAWTGEVFEFEGRTVRVAPKPLSPGGPGLLMGGNSVAAARRAARFDMGLLAQGLNPEIEAIYRSECEKLGKPPGLCINPPPQTVTSAFVAEDVDRAWSEFGPHLLHDAQAYARWMTHGTTLTTTVAASVEELRAQQGVYRIFSVDEAVDYVKQNGLFLTHPLCGGLPPKLAWPSLELLVNEVLPRARA